ncbi:MAG TPA: hypothetical protein VMZ91_12220, partial [Candidatus Paceibacterota bacterium]|nr:hypothetical protein [Candidatus Paceibacterota bacterium]
MKILSIDVETTGLDTENCMLLEFGAVVEDTLDVKPINECPSFNCIVENSGLLLGSAFALDMNKGILEILAGQERLDKEELIEYRKKYGIVKYEDIASQFYYFLQVAG